MIIELHTPQGVIEKDTETMTQAELDALGMPHVNELNDKHEAAMLALANWDSLTLIQKDTILKNLLWYVLVVEGYI